MAFRLRTSTKVALASVACRTLLSVRRLAGLGSEALVTRGGIRWQLDLTEGIDLAIYLFGRFEPQTVRVFRHLLRPGDVAIDVGANIGANTLELARFVGADGRVIAFEPTVFAFERLQRNAALNPALAQRISVEHAFLAGEDSPREIPAFYSSWPLVREAGTPLHLKHRGQLKTVGAASRWLLDQYLEAHDISAVRLIKVDVDGNELSVLSGAQRTLQRLRPYIVMELAPYSLDEQPGSLEAILNLFKHAQYVLADIPSGKKLDFSADVLRRLIPDGTGINVLAQPGPKPAD
jgi:FkbM family methyltransferase